ncbi:MAG: TfoX/Sxy family DNA transformation protein [Planctomycetales bacterium]|nr:TfoX/Sxy family DNA transformation protein [Planctomycetales bacterium]
MPDPKGDKLFVNVSAAAARRRLKGFGHGVRKIQSNGRNQAVVIHTATGRHLEELQRQFDDVGFACTELELGESVENLRNLGPTSAAWLREAGMHTVAELRRLGPALAYRRVKKQQPKVSLNLLWALAAGLADLDWRELTAAQKQALRKEIEE